MEINAYTLSVIAGGFTIVGALIGALSAYWLSIRLERDKERRAACAKLRAAFAPALAMIYLARHHGPDDPPDDVMFIQNELPKQAAAVEEFRAFVSNNDQVTYQTAWENYREEARRNAFGRAGREWALGEEEKREVPSGEIVEEKICSLLNFAET